MFIMDLALRRVLFELAHAPERIRMPCHLLIDLAEAT
jgi:hypothetical protein